MNDVLGVLARSVHPLIAIGLPEAIVVAANAATTDLFGQTADSLVGRPEASLYRGADEVHATIALAAIASGAIDRFSARRRLATPNDDSAWVSVRRVELQDVTVAIAMSVPLDQHPPDEIEQELATATGIAWTAGPSTDTRVGAEGLQRRINANAIATLDSLSARQRQIIAALLQGERTPAIAASMFVSHSTVRSHLTSIFDAFDVRSQSELLSLLRHLATGPRREPTRNEGPTG